MKPLRINDPSAVAAWRAELLALLVERSFRMSATPAFTLASGALSRYYIDLKQTVLTARGAYLVGRLMHARVAPLAPDAVGGLTLGADPIAVSTAVVSALEPPTIAAFVVRKQAKGHGTGAWIEGGLSPNARVIVLEDVVTTGGSTLTAIERVRAHGCRILLAAAVIDRGEGGREAIEAAGVPFDALFTMADLLGRSGHY